MLTELDSSHLAIIVVTISSVEAEYQIMAYTAFEMSAHFGY